ncbi:hypothetical protein KR044_012829 [Drosophila immigrans]|nr:hypothetical protein KR044_012829 [Drosophila immigrans]
MTSVCSNNYQHFQLTNGNIMLLHHQQQQHHLQQQQQQLQLVQQQQQQLVQHQLIAPKLPLGNSQLQNMQHGSSIGPMKKKFSSNSNSNSLPYHNVGGGEQMPSVARRNARERNRVKQVNNGFVNLRQHLPQSVINTLSNGGRGASKKLSKVDTLRIAVEYIRGLQDMLDDGSQPTSRRPLFAHSGDESSNDGSYSNDYNDSSLDIDSPTQAPFVSHSYHSASPTPSYTDSDLSASYVKQELPDDQQQQQQQHNHHHQLQHQQQQFKFESFDSFSDEQPDDEELLDYISSWQEQ